MPIATADVLRVDGGDNDPGVKQTVYVSRLSDILTFPTVVAVPTTYAERVTITADVVFQLGKCWKKLQLTVRKSFLDGASAGERQSKGAINSFEGYIAKVTAELMGWVEEHKNDDLVFCIPMLDGTVRLLGSEDLPATIETWEAKGGADVNDPKYMMFKAEAVGRIAPFYEGDISLTPAV